MFDVLFEYSVSDACKCQEHDAMVNQLHASNCDRMFAI